jgi:hypothetical protein
LPAFLLVAACFALTGAAGLVYEVVWNRLLALRACAPPASPAACG